MLVIRPDPHDMEADVWEENMAFDDILEELTPADRMRVLAWLSAKPSIRAKWSSNSAWRIVRSSFGWFAILCSSPTLTDPDAHIEVVDCG